MGRTPCTELQWQYKSALYLYVHHEGILWFWSINSIHSYHRYYIDGSGQPYTLAALLAGKSSISHGIEAGVFFAEK